MLHCPAHEQHHTLIVLTVATESSVLTDLVWQCPCQLVPAQVYCFQDVRRQAQLQRQPPCEAVVTELVGSQVTPVHRHRQWPRQVIVTANQQQYTRCYITTNVV
jgi:hypothetical protein